MDGKQLPMGSFPTMITPFTSGGAIDWACLAGLIEWYIAAGCKGLFACCLSSEMYNLTEQERLDLAEFVHTKAAGRAAVVGSGTFGGTIEEQAAFVNKMATKVDAVVVLVCQMCKEDESEEVWKANVSARLRLNLSVVLNCLSNPGGQAAGAH
jgi:4-hydroxy-tetrahydrodipicolinate synthase